MLISVVTARTINNSIHENIGGQGHFARPSQCVCVLVVLLVFIEFVLGQPQPYFVIEGNTPEFAFPLGSNLNTWFANDQQPVGSQNIFGGVVTRGIWSNKQGIWVLVSDNSLASLCWSNDGTVFPGGGAPPQCSPNPGGTLAISDGTYSASRDLWVFGLSSAGSSRFLVSNGSPIMGQHMTLNAVATSVIDQSVWGITYSDLHDIFIAVGQLTSPSGLY
jgi:hypothetical protein